MGILTRYVYYYGTEQIWYNNNDDNNNDDNNNDDNNIMIITMMIITMMIITMMIITKTIIIPNKGSGVEVTESVSRTTLSNLAFTTIFSPGLTKYIFNKYFRVLKQNQS